MIDDLGLEVVVVAQQQQIVVRLSRILQRDDRHALPLLGEGVLVLVGARVETELRELAGIQEIHEVLSLHRADSRGQAGPGGREGQLAGGTLDEVIAGAGEVRGPLCRGQHHPLVGGGEAGVGPEADSIALQNEERGGIEADHLADRGVPVCGRIPVQGQLVHVLDDHLAIVGGGRIDIELGDPGVPSQVPGTSILDRGGLEERHEPFPVRGEGQALVAPVVAATRGRGCRAVEVQRPRVVALVRDDRVGLQEQLLKPGFCVEPVDPGTVFITDPVATAGNEGDSLGIEGASPTADRPGGGLREDGGIGVGGVETREGKSLGSVGEQRGGHVRECDLVLSHRRRAVVGRDREVEHLEARTKIGRTIAEAAIRQANEASRNPTVGIHQRVGVDHHGREPTEGVLTAIPGLVEGVGGQSTDAHQALVDESAEQGGRVGRTQRVHPEVIHAPVPAVGAGVGEAQADAGLIVGLRQPVEFLALRFDRVVVDPGLDERRQCLRDGRGNEGAIGASDRVAVLIDIGGDVAAFRCEGRHRIDGTRLGADDVRTVQVVGDRHPGDAAVDRVFQGTDAVLVLFVEALEADVDVGATGEVEVRR